MITKLLMQAGQLGIKKLPLYKKDFKNIIKFGKPKSKQVWPQSCLVPPFHSNIGAIFWFSMGQITH